MKKKLSWKIGIAAVAGMLVFAGCQDAAAPETAVQTAQSRGAELDAETAQSQGAEVNAEAADSGQTDGKQPKTSQMKTGSPMSEATQSQSAELGAEAAQPQSAEVNAEAPDREETLGNPRSSYGLGSAPFLAGKNVLISLFVDTPESNWDEVQKEQILARIETAVSYLEAQAAAYGVEAELLYDFTEHPDLKIEAATDFAIREDVDFVDRLDEEIALWKQEKVSYEEVLAHYDAAGIAMMIFVNNPGISYAIVYDGTDSEQETMVLFAEDYYEPGRAETAAAYAHEILHVFGAHDLYAGAEFTKEVSDYTAKVYPDEIMYSVAEQNGKITRRLSPITAYHLGWIEEAEELKLFPQLMRE